ncbi:helix-turn-helix domain-containing protein [Pseudomonas monteilii]|nr:helix-turn-helix domain-containing protein [Pseudomonas monteilii]
MTTDRQPRDMLTIKELSELFGISRQAMRKHVDNLETTYLAKNNHGYKTVLWSGVLQLADKLGQPELFQETTQQQESPDIPSDVTLTTELLAQLKQKDAQIEQLQALLAQQQKLIDQQQQLTLQANKQIERLEAQEHLTTVSEEQKDQEPSTKQTVYKTPEKAANVPYFHFDPESIKNDTSAHSNKKWWHFFRKEP